MSPIEKWNYPAAFRDVVRLHNDPSNIAIRPEGVIVTYFSNLLSRKVGFSLHAYEGDPLSDESLASALNMDTGILDELEESLRETTDKIMQSSLAK